MEQSTLERPPVNISKLAKLCLLFLLGLAIVGYLAITHATNARISANEQAMSCLNPRQIDEQSKVPDCAEMIISKYGHSGTVRDIVVVSYAASQGRNPYAQQWRDLRNSVQLSFEQRGLQTKLFDWLFLPRAFYAEPTVN